MESLLKQKEWRIIDQSSLGPDFQALQSFASDDTLCQVVGRKTSAATARTWVHHQTVVLGIQDTRLPYLHKAKSSLEEQGYQVIVRNSGGLAVVLDEGVLNISLIFPDSEKGIQIDRGYESMVELMRMILSDYHVHVKAKEIVGSYCPGSYDLSIRDLKFAGISQRRLRGGVAVQIYISITGSGSERAKLIRDFYQIGHNGEQTKFTYPTINPQTMASLSELTGQPITVQDIMLRLFHTLKANSQNGKIYTSTLNGEEELSLYQDNYQRIIDRNIKAMGTVPL